MLSDPDGYVLVLQKSHIFWQVPYILGDLVVTYLMEMPSKRFKYGQPYTDETEEYIIQLLSEPYIQGLTILGGEPLEPENQRGLIRLLQRVKSEYPEKDVWCYTGYTLEQAMTDGANCRCDVTDSLLSLIDVLVDGRFVEDLKDITLEFRGSSNQRIISMKEWRESLEKK